MSAASSRDLDTTATLLVRGWAPPTPSICRGSGEPMTRSRKRSLASAPTGRSSCKKYKPFEVPPRINVAGTETCILSLPTPRNAILLLLVDHACCKYQGRAHPLQSVCVFLLRWPPADPLFLLRQPRCLLGTTTTPSSSATTRSPARTTAPAQVTVVLTFPRVSFTVP